MNDHLELHRWLQMVMSILNRNRALKYCIYDATFVNANSFEKEKEKNEIKHAHIQTKYGWTQIAKAMSENRFGLCGMTYLHSAG